MARILSRRADGAPPTADANPADQPTVVVPAQESNPPAPEVAADEPDAEAPAGDPAQALAAAEADPTLPAGAEPTPPEAPSFRHRGRLRRRLRYLRRVREIAFRDLGGLVFDLDRFGRERPDLVRLKLDGLRAIDTELRTLEVVLGDVRAVDELQEPGIAACAGCGALHGSEARFCPACGTAVDAPVKTPDPPAAAPAPAADQQQA